MGYITMRDLMKLSKPDQHTVMADPKLTAFAPSPAKVTESRKTDLAVITPEQAVVIYNKFGYDFDFTEFVMGMNVELEHDDVTQGNLEMTAKIAAAHLREVPKYYTLLKKYIEK